MPVAFAQDASKSIYDDEVPQTEASKPPAEPTNLIAGDAIKTEKIGDVSVKTNKFLEKHIEVARKWIHGQTELAQKQVDNTLQQYLHVEKSVTSTVAELKSDKEDILPGAIYVLIGTLSGSVFARRRGFVIRAISPIVFGVGAFSYFLPKTFANTRSLVWSFEKQSPAIADTHIKVQTQIEDLASGAKDAVASGQSHLESGVHSAREFIASTTGLQIGSSNKKK